MRASAWEHGPPTAVIPRSAAIRVFATPSAAARLRWAVLYCGGLDSSRGSDRKDARDEKADREHLLDPRRGYAGPGRTGRERQRRLCVRWLVGDLLGRPNGPGHGRGDEHAVRPCARTPDLRHLRSLLAE